MAEGFIIAAPSTGSGKTLVTLALLRALKRMGVSVASCKAGPDYIDPRFHEAASGAPCLNLDSWAMRPVLWKSLLARQAREAELVIIEGVMGLFDGSTGGQGSTAELARATNLPIVLVVDAARQGQSIAALIHGFKTFRPDVRVAGVILNRVASARHADLLTENLQGENLIGWLPRMDELKLPERHLGLVQASEIASLEAYLEKAADVVLEHLDFSKLPGAATPRYGTMPGLAPLGQTIAIARDEAFGFLYSHIAESWRQQGAQITFFSPLNNEAVPEAAAVFLPGGYPELHAGKLATAATFRASLRKAAERALIYGECGGFMVLGRDLIDADGRHHAMAGLLPHTTSFAARKLALGYRMVSHTSPLGWPRHLRGHEFHYSTQTTPHEADPLFRVKGIQGEDLGVAGLKRNRVMGSYIHIIDQEPT